MQFTVEQIRSVRNSYLDPPYPGFSLEEVCRRRNTTPSKLVRGANAWTAHGTARTTEEWVSRLVQGSLNKLSERNFDVMVDKLRTKELFATEDILTNVVSLIFRKALDEPENSKLYAGVCFALAMYEVSLSEQTTRPKSELRNAIIFTAQSEFRAFRADNIANDASLSDEEREQRRSNFMRRKRANMRFVGELFLNDVLSHATMLTIMEITMKEAAEGGFPASENIELLAELLTTVGEQLDQRQKKELDYHFGLLAKLIRRSDNPYPHRIRFKIMDLLDLRASGWGSRPKLQKPAAAAAATTTTATTATAQTTTSSSSSPTAAGKDTMRGRTLGAVSSPTVRKSHGKFAHDTAFAAAAVATSPSSDANKPRRGGAAGGGGSSSNNSGVAAAATAVTAAAGMGDGSGAERTSTGGAKGVRSSPPPPPPLSSSSASLPRVAGGGAGAGAAAVATAASVGAAVATPVNFERRVRAMFEEWAAERTNDFIPQWIEEFNACDRRFASADELCTAVAMEVIREACTTTRKDAQREAYSFLIVGLFLTDEEVLCGFAGALAAAIEDGLLEDVPKFAERFMQMLRLTSTEEETNADVYYDAANVLRMAYNQLASPDSSAVDTLMGFWGKVATPGSDEERVILSFPVLYSLCDTTSAQPGLAKLLSAIVHAMYTMGIVEDDAVRELLAFDGDNDLCRAVAREYAQLHGEA